MFWPWKLILRVHLDVNVLSFYAICDYAQLIHRSSLLCQIVPQLRNIGPNPGFLHQLRLFEKMGNRIVQSHPDYRAFALDKLTAKVRQASFGRKQIKAFKDDSELNGAAMDRALALDPALVNAAAGNKDDESSKLSSQKPKLLFRCRCGPQRRKTA